LVELKLNLTHKLADLRLAEVELAKYQDIDEQYRAVLTEAEAPTRPSSIDIVRKNGYDLRHTIEKKKALLIKVTELETSIKKLDPQYKSVIVATKYPHVGRSN
jgi:TRAP-type C4-dicarboxylate transport system substrate-binding protein